MSLIPVFGTKWLISDISHGSLYLLSYALLLLSIGGIILFSPKNLLFLGVLCVAIMSAQQLEMLSLSLLAYNELGSTYSYAHLAATEKRVIFAEFIGRLLGDCSITFTVFFRIKKSEDILYPILVFIMIMLVCVGVGFKSFKAKITRKKHNI